MSELIMLVYVTQSVAHLPSEIRIDPSPSEYPVQLDLWVDDKKYHSFAPIKAGDQLRWDFQSLPYDVHENSRIKLRIKEHYLIYSSKRQEVEYLTHEAAGKTSIARDLEPLTSRSACERAQSRITIEFPGLHEISTDFSIAHMRVNGGLDNTSAESEAVVAARQVFREIHKFVNEVFELKPAVKLALVIFEAIWQRVEKSVQKRKPNIMELMSGLESLLPLIQLVKEHAQEEVLTATISKLVNIIEDASYFVIIYLPENDAARALRNSMEETEKERLGFLMRKFTQFKDQFNAGVGGEILKRAATNEQRTLLDKLDPVTHSHYKFTKPCLEGTRTKFLEEINDWTQNRDEKLLWVHGQAGLGKSTIAASICKMLDAAGVLGAHFFCRRDDSELRSPERLLNTLVYRLAAHYKPYGNLVATTIGDNPEVPRSTLEERYTQLVETPLRKLEAEQARPARVLFLVVDALDECEQRNSQQLLSNFLFSTSLIPWIKVIITSRPELHFQSLLANANNLRVITRNLREEDASDDVATFVQQRLADIASRKSLLEWPEAGVQKLANRAGGLFIWAVTACKFIESGSSPIARFQQILNGTQTPKGLEKLDMLYTAAIKLSMDDDAEDNVQHVRMCLRAIVATASRTPLPISGLEALLRERIEPGVFRNIVARLGSVLYEDSSDDGAVRAFHPSFIEYLLDKSRCNEFYMDPKDQNTVLADCCLSTMMKELEFNICGLEMSHSLSFTVSEIETLVKAKFQAHLEYSCEHWASHLACTPWGTLQSALDKFLWGEPLLFWIEALGLLSKLRFALLNLEQLIAWIPNTEKWYSACADDARRFVLYFHDVISISAPHLYVSALAFVSKKFDVARRMRPSFSDTFARAAGTEINQPKILRNISLTQGTRCIACSPCGDRIASGLTHGEVQILDIGTGAIALEMQAVDSVDIKFVMFSANGQRMVTISDGLTIQLWDVDSGTVWRTLDRPFTANSSTAFSTAAFFPDDHQIVAVSHDCIMWTFDAETTAATFTRLEGPPLIYDFFLSPAGHRVAGSTNNEVKVWSMNTGFEVATVAHGLGPFQGVSLAPDGRRIATRSSSLLSIWDANTGSPLHKILQPEAQGYSLAFSPDNRHLLECLNNSLQLWNIEAGIQIWFVVVRPAPNELITAHMEFATHVAFSTDGRRAISRLDADTVQIWDMKNRISLFEPVGHQLELKPPPVAPIPNPPSPQYAASVPYDPIMEIWNAETDAEVSGTRHGAMKCVIFSPDGRHYARIFENGMTQILDTKEDADFPILVLEVQASSVAFSCDGHRVVLGSGNLVQIWELGANTEPLELEGHKLPTSTVAFSPNGRLVASGSHDKSVRIWNAERGVESLHALYADDAVHRVVFLRNGDLCQVISVYEQGAIRIWDTCTGTMVKLLNFTPFHDGELYPLDCADSQYFAFGIFKLIRSYDKERKTGRPTIIGCSGIIHSVSLSSDGCCIASNAEANKMWIWNVDTTSDVPRIMKNIGYPHGRQLITDGPESIGLIQGVSG